MFDIKKVFEDFLYNSELPYSWLKIVAVMVLEAHEKVKNSGSKNHYLKYCAVENEALPFLFGNFLNCNQNILI